MDNNDVEQMVKVTRKMAKEQPPEQPGTGTIPSVPSDSEQQGMSQGGGDHDQTLDSKMLQQFHQPAQGSEGGYASDGLNHSSDEEQ